ncbi:MAG: hypothetical protein KKB39_02080 [Nanoarchaeota archaeon]|nr:hypothetical protein [Nanoarchaeota archaeon]
MRKTILATLVMMLLVASLVFGALQLPGLKIATEDIVQEKVVEEAKVEPIKEEAVALSIVKTISSKLSKGAVCKLGNECATGFCKCTCVKSEVKEQIIGKEGAIEEKVEATPSVKLLALTAKLTLNLPVVEAEEEQTEEIVEEPTVVSTPIIQDQGLKIAIPQINEDTKPLAIKQEVKEECESGIYDCVCSVCVSDNDCGAGSCVNGECKEIKAEKTEVNTLCNTNDDCKSGKCEEKRIGGFFGLGGKIEKRCTEAALVQEQAKEAVSAPLKTSTVNTLLSNLGPLENKMQELEDKAVNDLLVTRNQLEERCPSCRNIPLTKDEASLNLRKKNVEKRLSILNDILTNKGTLSLEQSKKIKQTMNLNKKVVSEVKPESSGFLKIFGFVTKIIPTGMFTQIGIAGVVNQQQSIGDLEQVFEEHSCLICRDIEEYKIILSQMFDSLRTIESKLCVLNLITCPIGDWEDLD